MLDFSDTESTETQKTIKLDPAWSILSGAALFVLGVFICGSVATHNPLDSSWNVATEFKTTNFFGAFGAKFSDALLQLFGWPSWVAGFVIMISGLRRLGFRAQPKFQNWLLATSCFVALSSAVSILPVPKSWPFPIGLGGLVGDLLLGGLTIPLKAMLLPYPKVLSALIWSAGLGYWGSALMPRASYWIKYGLRSLFIVAMVALAFLRRQTRKSASSLGKFGSAFKSPVKYEGQTWQTNPLVSAMSSDTPRVNSALNKSPANFSERNKTEINASPNNTDNTSDDESKSQKNINISNLSINGLRNKLTDAYSELKAHFMPADNDAPIMGEWSQPDPSENNSVKNTPRQNFDDSGTVPLKPKTDSKSKPRKTKPRTSSAQIIGVPPIVLLDVPKTQRAQINEPALLATAEKLSAILKDFGVNGKITEIRPGPVVTLFELEPARGVKSARIIALADDIARSIEAVSARMAVIPGKNAIGIELPNDTRETVFLRELLESDAYSRNTDRLPMALGEDIGGEPTVVNLAKMPHLLIAGTTGSGKSVGVNAMILSLIYRLPPSECRFIMIDPKMLELSIYEGIPHLLCPVVTDPSKAVNALKWAVMEMESRYELMSKAGVRNLAGFNEKAAKYRARGESLTRDISVGFDETGQEMFEHEILPTKHIPNIVVIIDEMADLMMVAGKEIEGCVQRLAQMARAAGIHLITATQRPSVDVITGTIKANFPTRISYMVTTKIDSRTILGEQGAEQLLGMGDLLYQAPGKRPRRLHGPFVSDEEVESVVTWLKKQGAPDYVDDILEGPDEGNTSAVMDAIMGTTTGDKDEDLYAQAIAIVTQDNRASTSYLQRRLKIGYNKAAGLMDRLEENGVISPPNHAGKREIYGQSHSRDLAAGL